MLTVYRSSAGAGKTFALTGRYIDLLFSMRGRNRHRKILAVTFTKKATAEMKSRIVFFLSQLATGTNSPHKERIQKSTGLSDGELQQQAQDILTDILQDYSSFAVTTIDSFFQQIIRSFSKELNLPGAYNLELDSNHVRSAALDDYFFNIPSDLNDERVRALLQVVGDNMEEGGRWNPHDSILSVSDELFKETYQEHRQELHDVTEDPDALGKYRKQLKKIVNDYLSEYRALEQKMLSCMGELKESDFPPGALTPFHWKKKKDILENIGKKAGVRFTNLAFEPDKLSKKPELQQAVALLQPLARRLYDMLYADSDCRRKFVTAVTVLSYISYVKILQDVEYFIQKANTELNRLPISETNTLIHDVVAQQEDSPFIYDKLGVRLSHFMIDEFQDTSSMQWRNFLPLVREAVAKGGICLLVGDVKQSIYRFRNSDSSLLQYGVNSIFRDIHEEQLTGNWRSSSVIVEQNNRIFSLLSAKIAALYSERSNKASCITDIYSSVSQETRLAEGGYVRMEFLSSDKKAKGREEVAMRLPELLEDLFSRGIKAGHIALLIRDNKDATLLASTLLGAGINVMSTEGLLVKSAPEVRLVTDLLALWLTPDDDILRLQTMYEYALVVDGNSPNKALERTIREDVNLPQQHYSLSLPEQVADIISELHLMKNETARPYLLALQDVVYNYTNKYAADACSFVEWWEENSGKAAIQMQSSDDAVQIVSIHKSKGLEYDVVIVPFCDWDAAEKQNNNKNNRINLLWLEPAEAPFNTLPIVPVEFGKRLGYSIFRDDYFKELEQLYIDNLNITYVAFTRAKHELYVFAPSAFNSKSPVTSNMGGVLYSVLEDDLVDGVYERGVKSDWHAEQQNEETVIMIPGDMPGAGSTRLHIKLPSRDWFLQEEDISTDHRFIGSMMHEVLCKVVHLDDAASVVDDMLKEGKLRVEDVAIVQTELQRFRELVATTDWFSDKWQVMNEQDIVTADGNVKRPDRLMFCGDEAVIVDWKFGWKKPDEYIQQVREYMLLISTMGYHPRGFLCYVNRKEIVEVKI